MATISKEMVEMLIGNDGYYPGDPRISKAVRYNNQYGGESYAIVYPHEDQFRYENSPACSDVVTIWTADV